MTQNQRSYGIVNLDSLACQAPANRPRLSVGHSRDRIVRPKLRWIAAAAKPREGRPRPGAFRVEPGCCRRLGLGVRRLGAQARSLWAEGIQSAEPRGGSDGRRMEDGRLLSHGVRGRSLNCLGWLRRLVEHHKHPQRSPLIGPIVHQRGCRSRQRYATRAAQARARHARPRDRRVTGRLP